MNYSNIKNFDVANGSGIGVSLFVSGCSFHCPGCFNAETWPFDSGNEFNLEVENKMFDMLNNKHIDHFSILGGEPFHPLNVTKVCELIIKCKEKYPDKKIWLWTGYDDFDELLSDKNQEQIQILKNAMNCLDYITYGRFDINTRDLRRKYSGSSNQYTISLKDNKILEDKSC